MKFPPSAEGDDLQNNPFPEVTGIARQYQNRAINLTSRHPVLEWQMMTSQGLWPANYGDPIRIADVAGPISPNIEKQALEIRPNAPINNFGPVPKSALKQTSEVYNPYQFRNQTLGADALLGVPGAGGRLPAASSSWGIYGPSLGGGIPFIGSDPLNLSGNPEVITPWEKAGILVSMPPRGDEKGNSTDRLEEGQHILNLFRRPIAPVQELWEYQVQDKNGFVIRLSETNINDGDIIHHVIGKHGLGPWKAHVFVQNRYIYV
jgi:hypothetical protein